jgi:hypothetical protein
MSDGIFLEKFGDMSKYTLTKEYFNMPTQIDTSSLPRGHLTIMFLVNQM